MNTQSLHNVGLTDGEIKIYIALTKLGEAKKTALAKESGVSSSKVYEICERLEKKGLIGHIIKDNIKVFTSMEPSFLLDYFEKKSKDFEKQKKELENLIPSLSKLKNKEQTNATLFQGIKAIKHFFLNILKELKKGDEYYVVGVNYGSNHPSLRAFFESFHRQRVQKGITVNMLVNESARDKLVQATLKKSSIKFLPNYMLSNMIILFYKNKSFIFFLTEDAIGFEIHNTEIAQGFKSYFDAFSKIAKE